MGKYLFLVGVVFVVYEFVFYVLLLLLSFTIELASILREEFVPLTGSQFGLEPFHSPL